jgi:hypothetical protein
MLDRMIEGLSTASPSATLVAEARALLSSHGIRAGSPLRGLLQLKEDALRLPFDLAVAPEETEQ